MAPCNPRLTAVNIRSEIYEYNDTPVSVWTVRRRVSKSGVNARRPAHKPLISEKNRGTRLDFARTPIDWKSEQWSEKNIDRALIQTWGSFALVIIKLLARCRWTPSL
ncbi:transposase [Ancylostoma ceylanicum]|uniref:Transposase n=1 Tax=Ancylostoma ceylanicum TaxID=53326 RepID=A0A0D6M3N1_9BILA|nr:transposase [Ancylostoma ceylanicum]